MTTPEPPPSHSAKTASGMQAARQRGVRLGRPEKAVPPSAGRADELRAAGLSYAAIAKALDKEQVPAPSGVAGHGAWTKSSVQYVLGRLDAARDAAAD